MTVIRLPKVSRPSHLPLVVFLDCQEEYTAEGRAYYVASAAAALANCVTLLASARNARLPIAHFKMAQDGHFFNDATPFASWAVGLTPRASEYVYRRNLPSGFSNQAFCDLMEHITEPELIIAGLTAERACLSTMVDCFHRGVQTTFVYDCSASAEVPGFTEAAMHEAATRIISNYGQISSLEEVCQRMNQFSMVRRIV